MFSPSLSPRDLSLPRFALRRDAGAGEKTKKKVA
jgi:hypothetical protein